jgi:cytochrome c5
MKKMFSGIAMGLLVVGVMAAPVQAADEAAAADGEKVYKGLCMSCHDTGLLNSPKLGDKDAWKDRIATGMDALYTSALNGKNTMPAKGGNPALSDAEVKAAVDYMVEKAK